MNQTQSTKTSRRRYGRMGSKVAALALAISAGAVAPQAIAQDSKAGNPCGPRQSRKSNPCGPSNPCAPKKRAGNPCGPSNPCGPKKKKAE